MLVNMCVQPRAFVGSLAELCVASSLGTIDNIVILFDGRGVTRWSLVFERQKCDALVYAECRHDIKAEFAGWTILHIPPSWCPKLQWEFQQHPPQTIIA